MTDAAVLHLRNDTSELRRAASEVARYAEAHGVSDRDVFEVNLALDEVLTNVIWYAFEDDDDHDIVVRMDFDGGDLMIEVEDDGKPFDPLALEQEDLDLGLPAHERRVGGLGIYIVRQVMNALAYRREMGKNVLTMRRRVSKKE